MVSDRDADADADTDVDVDVDTDATMNSKRTLAYCQQQQKQNGSDCGLPRTAAPTLPARTFYDHNLRNAVSRICLWRWRRSKSRVAARVITTGNIHAGMPRRHTPFAIETDSFWGSRKINLKANKKLKLHCIVFVSFAFVV